MYLVSNAYSIVYQWFSGKVGLREIELCRENKSSYTSSSSFQHLLLLHTSLLPWQPGNKCILYPYVHRYS